MATATAAAYLTAMALLITAVTAITAAAPAATHYTNHTVGGGAGWFFNTTTNTSSFNYTSWAATQTFNLGDFLSQLWFLCLIPQKMQNFLCCDVLVFNTNTNQTVIQTYNDTTYRSCSTDDASGDDTFQYGGGSDQFGVAATIAVPLTIEGSNYFFSDADDGVQCQQGMAFEIAVNHGLGLPPSLNQPPPPPYVAPPTPSGVQSPPVAVQPTSGGLRTTANLRWVVCALLFGCGFVSV
ncbi:hypothetical protein U1Q18_036179 [Sarracenia purpurea var. burkii]